MPILGIMASQISGKLWAPAGAYDALATVTPSGSVASISFTGIPTGYKHLQLRWIGKSTSTGTFTLLNFNGDSANNYSIHVLYGDGSSVGAENYPNNSAGAAGYPTTSSNPGVSANILDILDYANTSKYKTIRALSGKDNNGSGLIGFISSAWYSTSAINRLDIAINAGNWATTSQFSLFGVK